jgi:putative transposase
MDSFIRKQSIGCKYCNSTNIVKYGTFQAMQRYFCKSCHRKFADNDALPKMKTPIWIISLALNCYYDGMSLRGIQGEINQRHGAYYAQSSIYNWIFRFSEEAIRQAKLFQPKVGDIWLLCSTPIRTGNRLLWFWDIFDMNSNYLLASHLSETGTESELVGFINSTHLIINKAHHYPITLMLSGAFVGAEPVTKTKESELSHKVLLIKSDENSTMPFYEILKKRNKVVHSFKSINKAQTLTDAWLVHYNYLAGNDKIGHTSPVQKMGKAPFKNWADIIIQSTIKK